MNAYYNEIESFCGRVLETNIARGHLPPGKIDIRDIREVKTKDVINYRQIHLFAGIGAAAAACRLAELPDDFSIATCGFPCQDISGAGKGAGIGGARSGLFWNALALLEAVRPTWILFENVPVLRTRGIEFVIAGVEKAGYCALPPIVVGADDIGAPQRRKRVWIVARNATGIMADPDNFSRWSESQIERSEERARRQFDGSGRGDAMENAACERTRQLPARQGHEGKRARDFDRASFQLANADGATPQKQRLSLSISEEFYSPRCESSMWPAAFGTEQHEWEPPRTIEPALGRDANGITPGLVRRWRSWRRNALKGLGNAWVPQTAVPILKWIYLTENALTSK